MNSMNDDISVASGDCSVLGDQVKSSTIEESDMYSIASTSSRKKLNMQSSSSRKSRTSGGVGSDILMGSFPPIETTSKGVEGNSVRRGISLSNLGEEPENKGGKERCGNGRLYKKGFS